MRKEHRKISVSFAQICVLRAAIKYAIERGQFGAETKSQEQTSPWEIAKACETILDKKYKDVLQNRLGHSCASCNQTPQK